MKELQKYISEHHLSLRSASALCGCSPSTLSRVLRGISTPDRCTAARIAELIKSGKAAIPRGSGMYWALRPRIEELEARVKKLEESS